MLIYKNLKKEHGTLENKDLNNQLNSNKLTSINLKNLNRNALDKPLDRESSFTASRKQPKETA